jgi:hypothetical protein
VLVREGGRLRVAAVTFLQHEARRSRGNAAHIPALVLRAFVAAVEAGARPCWRYVIQRVITHLSGPVVLGYDQTWARPLPDPPRGATDLGRRCCGARSPRPARPVGGPR